MSGNEKQLEDLQKQIDKFAKRRSELEADLGKRTQAIAEKRQSLASERLAGHDTAKATATLANESLEVDATQEAIIMADDELRRLKQEYDQIERAGIKAEFDRVGGEAYGLFLDCLDQLHGAVAILDQLHSKLLQANEAGAPGGFAVEHDENLRLVEAACRYWRGVHGSEGNIAHRIEVIERGYANTIAHARALKAL